VHTSCAVPDVCVGGDYSPVQDEGLPVKWKDTDGKGGGEAGELKDKKHSGVRGGYGHRKKALTRKHRKKETWGRRQFLLLTGGPRGQKVLTTALEYEK